MHPLLTLENLLTLAGVVAFIEIALELFIKPALQGWKESRWYGLLLNGVAFFVALGGATLATWAAGEPTTGPAVVAIGFRALEATAIAILGFEIAKNAKRLLGAE